MVRISGELERGKGVPEACPHCRSWGPLSPAAQPVSAQLKNHSNPKAMPTYFWQMLGQFCLRGAVPVIGLRATCFLHTLRGHVYRGTTDGYTFSSTKTKKLFQYQILLKFGPPEAHSRLVAPSSRPVRGRLVRATPPWHDVG